MKKILSMVLAVCLIASFTFGCFPLAVGAATTDYSDAVLKYVEANTEKGNLELGAYWTPQGSAFLYPTGETDSDGKPTYKQDADGNNIYNEEAYKALLQKYVDAGLNFAVTGNEVYEPRQLDLTVRKAAEVGLDVWFNMCLDNGSTTSVATFSDMWYKYLITAYLGLDYWVSPWKYVEGLTEETWKATYLDDAGIEHDVLTTAEKQAYYEKVWAENKDKINKDALAKLYICDEPAISAASSTKLYGHYSQLEAKLKEYGITTPSGINFYPITAITDSSGNSTYNYLSKYNKYLDYYLLNANEVFSGYTGTENTKINVSWLMFDYYMSQGSASSLYIAPYFVNAFYFMNYSQKLGLPNYQFVNVATQNNGGLYSPSEAQLLEATHLRLMLGVKGICYFLGWPAYNNSNGEWSDAMFNTDGTTTASYNKVKNVNAKINGMQGVYLTFENNDGVIEVNGTDVKTSLEQGKNAATYNAAAKGDVMKYNKTSTAALTSATGSHAYIGLFTKADSADEGFYVVNASTSAASSNVLNFSSEKYYQVWGENGLEEMGKASSLTVSNAASSAKFVIVSDAETTLVATYNNAVAAYEKVSADFKAINTALYTAASVAEVSAAITKLGNDIAANAAPEVLEADVAAATLDKLVASSGSDDPYEVVIKDNVVASMNAIIAYLDNTTDAVGSTGKDIKTLLTEKLAAYEADPSADTLSALTSAWDDWTYGGHDATKVFFTDYFLNLIASFPKQADGSVYIEAGAAKRTPAQLKEHMLAVDSALYVVNKAPSNFASEIDKMVVGMNSATVASETKPYLDTLIDFMNNNCMLLTAQTVYDNLAAAKTLATDTSGDATALEELEFAISYVEEELAGKDQYGYVSYPNAGFVQYRPAGQADSFTDDSVSYSNAFNNLNNDLKEYYDAYKATVVVKEDYEVTIKAEAVAAMKAIIAYLDNATDIVTSGKDIKTLLTEKLAAYEADTSKTTFDDMISVWDKWSYGGYDSAKVFATDTFKALIAAFPKQESGAVYLELGAAKKSPKNIVQQWMTKVDDALYVNNYGPSADYDTGSDTCIKNIGRNAMNSATTSSAAFEALQATIDYLNANCKLTAYANLEAKITEYEALVGTSGDASLYAEFTSVLAAAKNILANTAPVGFTQYRSVGQADSFTEDVAASVSSLTGAVEDLTTAAEAYKATIGQGEQSYEEKIKDDVVSSMNAIIAYLDNVTDTLSKFENKNIATLLTERLAAYSAAPSATTLNNLIAAWDEWSYGGYDSAKVFNTDVFDGLISAFPTKEDGSIYIELGGAKKSPKNIVQQYMTKVDDALYVNNYGPSADYDTGSDTCIKNIGRNAMNKAATASAAFAALQNAINYLNANCKLLSYANLEAKIAEVADLPATGDASLYEEFTAYLEEARQTIAKTAPVGFTEYRALGQADSFTEDVASSDAALKSALNDLTTAADAYKATIKAEDPYEVKIKEQVISATQAIINYLDNTATEVKDGKTITVLLTETLAAYTADPSATTLAAIVSVWDTWTYGGHDADRVFFTDYFKDLIAAFPTKEDGSIYIEAGSAKKTPKNIVQQWMTKVDDALYVNNYGPSADYDSGNSDSIKAIGRNAMNSATTSSAAFAALQNAIDHLKAVCKLTSYANLEAKIAEAKAVKDGGDATAKADLDAAVVEAEATLAKYGTVGFTQYRPAGQADSFTEDVAEANAAYVSATSDLDELIAAYNETIVVEDPYEVKIKEQVISATQAIIDYLDNTATVVTDGKTITELLTEALAAYTADPSAETLAGITGAWDSWTYGGHDADRVFFTDYFKDLIKAFPTKEDGSVYIEAGSAKKTPKNIIQQWMTKVDDALYVNNYGPSADYDSGNADSIKAIGRNAMNSATTASAAYAALQAAIAHLNASCKLISYADLEAKLAEAKAVKAGGDADAKAELDYAIGEAEKLMDAHKAVGFWQYRPAGQADSFTEDVAESDAAYKSMISDLTDLIDAYNATIPTGPSGLVIEENGDIRYYEDGVAVVKGLVKDEEGNYYFINSTKKAVKNTWYAFNDTYSNGLLPAGRYFFGEDGKLQLKNGVVVESNGDIRYYENGVAVVKGLVQDAEGNYYFINGTKKAVKNTWYAFNDTYANGLLPAGRYFFGEDGKLQMKNGVVVEANGDIRYYENNVAVAKGLVEYEGNYYFINSSLKAVKNTWYAFNAKYANGLMPAGRYFFDAEGKLVQQ